MTVTPDTVRQVAALARLSLGAEELAALTAQLNGILEHMEALTGVETAGAGPVAGPADAAPLRVDQPGADPLAVHPAELAPDFADGFFTVPRLASHADADDGPDAEAGEAG